MVLAGAFDGDDDVAEVVLGHYLANAVDGGVKVAASVRQDAKVFRAYLLDREVI